MKEESLAILKSLEGNLNQLKETDFPNYFNLKQNFIRF